MKSHDIKDILEERRIEVSENSWEKLASQLDANDKKKKKRRFYFPYAACLALVFSLVAFMLIKNDENTDAETVVDSEKIIKTKKDTTLPIIQKEKLNDELFKEAIVNTEEIKVLPKNETSITKEKEKVNKERVSVQQKNKLEVELQKEVKNAIVVASINTSSKVKTTEKPDGNEIKLNEELKASIAALSAAENIKITNEEIDQLLKEAQQSLSELDTPKEETDILRFATADELLNEVEYELDRSFKQKVFELIKHNVQRSRAVVVDD
ncbi:hypothetical protein [Kordia sp.]|uniref:hypothetical protein n=1 Tax=Kordia sp. TaxID=1965332 RepID=UPI003B5CD074